jgi:hypothetical protein
MGALSIKKIWEINEQKDAVGKQVAAGIIWCKG